MPARLLIIALLLTLAGWGEARATDAEAEFGKLLVRNLQARNLEAILAQLDPKISAGFGARAALAKMADVLPAGTPDAIEIVAGKARTYSWIIGDGTKQQVALGLQYRFGDKWFLVEMRWHVPHTGPRVIDDIRLTPLQASLQEINRFTLAGKGQGHYATLTLALALPIVTLLVLVMCIRTPMPLLQKALWSVAILVGMPTFSKNWTTGDVFFDPLRFQILSAGFGKTVAGPLILQISIPLGAMVFLWRSTRRPATGDGAATTT